MALRFDPSRLFPHNGLHLWRHSATVSTAVFQAANPGSIPGGATNCPASLTRTIRFSAPGGSARFPVALPELPPIEWYAGQLTRRSGLTEGSRSGFPSTTLRAGPSTTLRAGPSTTLRVNGTGRTSRAGPSAALSSTLLPSAALRGKRDRQDKQGRPLGCTFLGVAPFSFAQGRPFGCAQGKRDR